MLRVSTIKLVVPAVPPLVTKLTLIVTFPAVVLVAVNLSMIALQFTAVYCVVCVPSACFGGISTLIDTVI
jgi:NADH:ubiquinone oxidoreductase subunit 4 (subunit M)